MPAPELPGDGPEGSGPDQAGPEQAGPDVPISGDPSGAHDDLPPSEASLEDLGVVIPDDASALEADRQDLLDEQAGELAPVPADFRLREPPPGMPRIFSTQWRGLRLSGPLVIAVLLTVAVLGSFMTVLTPASGPTPGPQALATAPLGLIPGEAGALLPDTSVTLDGVPLELRRVRPVVLAVIPRSCPSCADTVASIQLQAREFGLRVMLVGAKEQQAQLRALSRSATNGLVGVLLDVDEGLTSLFPGTTATLVMVHSDGIIGSVIREPSADQLFDRQLSPLGEPALSPSST